MRLRLAKPVRPDLACRLRQHVRCGDNQRCIVGDSCGRPPRADRRRWRAQDPPGGGEQGAADRAVRDTALERSTVGQRCSGKAKPSEGGWHIFDAGSPGDECTSSACHDKLDASGNTTWCGWPKSDPVRARIAEWYAATDLAAEKTIIAEQNPAAIEDVNYIPPGFWKNPHA